MFKDSHGIAIRKLVTINHWPLIEKPKFWKQLLGQSFQNFGLEYFKLLLVHFKWDQTFFGKTFGVHTKPMCIENLKCYLAPNSIDDIVQSHQTCLGQTVGIRVQFGPCISFHAVILHTRTEDDAYMLGETKWVCY